MTAATDRHAQYFAGWPCAIAATAAKGRHLIAVRDFAQGETVLVSEAYLTALLPSQKKRICAACQHDCGRRLTVHCGGCDEAWYCSEACRDAHATGARASGVPAQEHSVLRIPHSMLCPVLSHFGGLKADADTECILRMCLDLLVLHCLEAAGSETGHGADSLQAATSPAHAMQSNGQLQMHMSEQAARAAPVSSEDNCLGAGGNTAVADAGEAAVANSPANGHSGDAAASNASDAQRTPPPLPPLRHADFSLLQCHPVSLSERDAQQWRRAMAFLSAALERSGWPQPLPSQAMLMSWAGRIAANSFYCYSDGGGQATPARRSRPHQEQQQQQQQQQQGLAQQCGAGSCEQPPAGSQQRTGQSPTVPQPAAGHAGGQQHNSASTTDSAGRPAQAQQQAAACVNAQQQLRRLQLAQRQLWQGSADTSADASAPHANSDADFSGNRLPAAGCSTAGTASNRPHQKPDTTSAAGFQAPQPPATAGSEAGVSGQSSATAEPQQQQEQPPQQNQQVRQGTTGDSSSTATLSSAAADTASNMRLQPVGRELFITASYLNHSCQPNCIIHRRAAVSVVTAQADIKAGDELCISYIDLELPRSARQAALTRMFHFACDCERCRQEEAEGSGKCSYGGSGGKGGKAGAPKRRRRKARTSR